MSVLVLGCSSSAPPPTTPAEHAPDEPPAATTETVRYPSGKDTVRGSLCRPQGQGPFPAVLLIHDALGLTDGIKEDATRLAKRGYVVLAVDLYRGETAQTVMDAHILERGVPEDRVRQDLKAAIDYLTQRQDVKPSALGVVGLGMGGGYALEAAVHDSRLHAVVNCYGRLVTDSRQLATLDGSVLCLFAGKDAGFSADTVEQFCRAANKAGKRIDAIRVYGECPYGFLDPANWSEYGKPNAGDVTEAWELIGKYLDRELKR